MGIGEYRYEPFQGFWFGGIDVEFQYLHDINIYVINYFNLMWLILTYGLYRKYQRHHITYLLM